MLPHLSAINVISARHIKLTSLVSRFLYIFYMRERVLVREDWLFDGSQATAIRLRWAKDAIST